MKEMMRRVMNEWDGERSMDEGDMVNEKMSVGEGEVCGWKKWMDERNEYEWG